MVVSGGAGQDKHDHTITRQGMHAPMADLVDEDGKEEDEDVRNDEVAEVDAPPKDAHDEGEDPVEGEEVVHLDGDHLPPERDGADLPRRLPREGTGVLDRGGRGPAAGVAHGWQELAGCWPCVCACVGRCEGE